MSGEATAELGAAQESQPAPAPIDLITNIQRKIADQSQMLVNLLGGLQQHAPPEVVITDRLIHEVAEVPVYQETLKLPEYIIAQTKTLDALISQIPDHLPEEDELAEIAKLQEESNALDEEISRRVNNAEDVLLKGLSLHQLLAEHSLHLRSLNRGTMPATPSQSKK